MLAGCENSVVARSPFEEAASAHRLRFGKIQPSSVGASLIREFLIG